MVFSALIYNFFFLNGFKCVTSFTQEDPAHPGHFMTFLDSVAGVKMGGRIVPDEEMVGEKKRCGIQKCLTVFKSRYRGTLIFF